jgi:hypothetical protein
MKILQILETAYRATLEEQDDTILWLTQALKGAGADLALLLRRNAVNYAVAAQQPVGLTIGEWRQSHPPALMTDLEVLRRKGVEIFVLEEDLEERGISRMELSGSVELVARPRLAELVAGFDRVWNG